MSVNIDLACGALNKTAQRLAGELWTPLVESLTDAAESLASTHGTDFALSPMNPIRVVIALSGGRDSMAMLDLMARFSMGTTNIWFLACVLFMCITASRKALPLGRCTVSAKAESEGFLLNAFT